MADAQAPTSNQAEDSRPFSEYVREENKREREGLPASGDASASAPEPAANEDVSLAGEQSGASEAAAPVPDEVEAPVADEAEDKKDPDLYVRKSDGTFKKRTPQDRINVAVRRQRAAEERAAQYERDLAALRAQAASVPTERPAEAGTQPATPPNRTQPQANGKPTLEQFLNEADPYAALSEAIGMWAADQRIAAYQQQQRQQAEEAQLWNRVDEAFQIGEETHPDFQQVMTSDFAKTFKSPQLMEAIYQMDSPELSAEALYFLGTHQQKAYELAALAQRAPLAASTRLGHYLASSAAHGSAASAPVISRAKPLIRPVGASPVASAPSPPDPEKTSFADWVKVNNAADRKARKEGRA